MRSKHFFPIFITTTIIALFTLFTPNAQAQDSSGVRCLSRIPIIANNVTVSGNFAYVSDTTGFHILNISDPVNPQIVGYYATQSSIRKIEIVGEFAYIANHASGLRILNISRPDSIFEVGSLTTLGTIYYVTIASNFAYLSSVRTGDYFPVLRVVDITNPNNPLAIGSDGPSSVLELKAYSNRIYSTFVGLLRITDISNPSNPQYLGGLGYPDMRGLAVSNNFVFLGYCAEYLDPRIGTIYFLRFTSVNVSNPASLRIFGSCDLPALVSSIELAGHFAYVTLGLSGLYVIDVDNPEYPRVIGHYNTPGNSLKVACNDSIAYVADGANFGIYDCSQIVGVDSPTEVMLPEYFSLEKPYPNPFNASTTIEYTIPKTGKVDLKIFDIAGREVAKLVDFHQNPGTYKIAFDGTSLSTGTYFLRLQSGAFSQTQKMVLLK